MDAQHAEELVTGLAEPNEDVQLIDGFRSLNWASIEEIRREGRDAQFRPYGGGVWLPCAAFVVSRQRRQPLAS